MSDDKPAVDPAVASLAAASEGTVMHVYHAAIEEKEFEANLHLPCVPKGAALTPEWYEKMKLAVNEISPTLWDSVKPLPCTVCGSPAVQLLHHPMLFDAKQPPRVEDLPQPICGKGACTARAEEEFRTMMNIMSPTTQQGKTCGHCSNTGDNLLRCSRCKCVYYCNAQCQKSHWPSHKVICKPN